MHDAWLVCPECNSKNVYQNEDCDDPDSVGLFNFCEDCGHTDLEKDDDGK